MAKKDKLKLDDFNFDLDEELNIPGFNFGSESVKDDRKPATKIKDSIKLGAKQSLSNTATYKKLLRNALPNEYGEAYDDASRIGNNIKRVYKEAVDEVKPAAADLARSAGTFVPDNMKRTKGLLDKVEKWAQKPDTASFDPSKQREDNISLELGNIFKAQILDQMRTKAEAKSSKKIDDALGVIRHRDQMSALNQISLDAQRLSQYQANVTQAFQRKSLELQYRSYYVQADMLELNRKSTVAITNRLDAISKNTGLPDYVKTRKSEYMKEQMRNQFLQGAVGGLFGNTRDAAEKFFENISRNIKAGAGQASQAFMAGAMGADTASAFSGMTDESMMEMAAREGIGALISGSAGRLGSSLRRVLQKISPTIHNKLEAGAQDLKYLRANGMAELLKFSRHHKDNPKLGTVGNTLARIFKDLLYDNIDKGTGNIDLLQDRMSDSRNPVPFTQQTQKSINEVIPGLLSRILREVTVLRTGDASTGMVEYDFKSNKFSTGKKITEDIKNTLFSAGKTNFFARNFDTYLDDFGLSDKLEEDDKRALAQHMLRARFKGQGFSRETFTDPSLMDKMSKKQAERISKVMNAHYDAEDVQGPNRVLEQKKRRASLAEWGNSLGSDLGDPRMALQEYLNAGQTERLEEAGFVRNGRVDIDGIIDKATESVGKIKANEMFSDMFLKENIKSIAPTKALEGIRNFGVKAWNYKKGSKADDGSQMHFGPMAQDVFSAFGNDVAPQGKKINIGNLTGAALSGIQAVDNKLQSVGEVLKAQMSMMSELIKSKFRKSKSGMPGSQEPTLDSAEPMHSAKEPTLRERLKTMEDLLAVIAANSSRHGHGIDFEQMYVKNGAIGKFRMRWPSIFKARAKTAQEERAEEQQERRTSKFTGLGGSIMDFIHSGIDLGGEIGSKAFGLAQQGFKDFKVRAKWMGRRVVKPALKKTTEKGLDLANTLGDRLQGVDDIYVRGENAPRMLKSKMLQGVYVNFDTGSVINRIKDITGAVMDTSEYNIVISADEVENLILRPTPISRAIDIGKDLAASAKRAAKNFFQNSLPAGWNMVYEIGKKLLSTTVSLIDQPRDVYVKGENIPRLFKVGFDNGLYFAKTSGKVIKTPGQIKDEIIDKDGNILLSKEDISKGLVDVHGKRVETVGTVIAGALGGALRGGIDTISNMFKFGGNLLGEISSKGWKGTKDFFKNLGFGIGGRESLDVLKQIRDILDTRLPARKKKILGDMDGDGDRDGSWQDIFQHQKTDPKSPEAKFKRAEAAKSYRTGNVLDKIQDKVTGMIGGLIDGALDLMGLGSLFGKAGKVGKAAGAAGEVAGAASKAGKLGSIFSKIKGLGTIGSLGGLAAGGGLLSKAGTIAGTGIKAGASMLPTLGSAAAAGGGLLSAIHRSGMRGVNGAFNLAGKVTPGLMNGAIGVGKLGMGAAGLGVKGLGLLGKGVGMLGRGVGRALPGLGVGLGLYGAYNNAMAGDYLGAAGNLGLAAVSGLGVGGTLSLLGTGLGALAGAVFSPVGLGVLAAGAAAYGLYKAYKWFTKKDFSPLSMLRMYQYGIGDKDEKYREQIYNLEKMLESSVQINGTQAQITEGKFKLEDILDIFSIKQDDQEAVNRFGVWFQNRFKPVYLTHMAAIFKTKGKLDIDLIDKELKEPKEKIEFLKQVAMPDGPWTEMTLPFPASPQSVVQPDVIRSVVESLRKSFLAEIKPGSDSSYDQKSWFGKLMSATPPDPKGTVTDVKLQSNESDTSKKITKALQSDIALKGGIGAISVGSDKNVDWYDPKNLSAFTVVRYKAYGLKKFEQGLVNSIKWLEQLCLEKMQKKADGTTQWTGDPQDVLVKARRYFGFDFNDQKQNDAWIDWFIRRFLPIYTTTVNLMAKAMGNDNYLAHQKSFDQESSQALQICKNINAMEKAWMVKSSPWPGIELSCDPSLTKGNLDYLEQVIKKKELAEQTANIGSKSTAGATGSPGSKLNSAKTAGDDYEAYKKRVAENQARTAASQAKIAQYQADLTGSQNDEGEPNQKASGSISQPATAKGDGGGSAQATPPQAAGDLMTGSGADKYIKKGGLEKLRNMHPEFLKLFMGAVQEYGEKTGRQIQIKEGFRTYEQQLALKAKHGPRAAAPGSSLHEFGMAIDVNSADADAMEQMGLFRKYGLTRPVGGEPWHVEPAGIQMAYNTYKKNWDAANSAIAAGVGKGGGGYGTVVGARKYGRNPELVKALLNKESKPGEGVKDLNNQIDQAKAFASGAITKASDSSKAVTRTSDGLNVTQGGNSKGYAGNIASIASEGEQSPSSSGISGNASGAGAGKPGISGLLDQISKGEGTSDEQAKAKGFASGYDVPLAYGKYGMPDKPITQMTLGKLKQYQAKVLANSGTLNSSAMGKYQIVGRTLKGLQQKLNLSDDTLFSPEIQDKMAVELLKGRGLDKYMSGKISADQFQSSLYHEWASIANPLTGVAKQHTGSSNSDMQTALAGLKSGGSTMTRTSDGLNIIQPSGATSVASGTTSTPMPSNAPVGGSSGFMSASGTTRKDPNLIQTAYRVTPPNAVPSIQPEIQKNNDQITSSIKNVTDILSSSLDVQKSILQVLQGLSASKANPANAAGAAGDIVPPKNTNDKIGKEIGESPISVKNRLMV